MPAIEACVEVLTKIISRAILKFQNSRQILLHKRLNNYSLVYSEI